MSWNYRAFKSIYNNEYSNEPDVLFEIREVFYDENGDISGIADPPEVFADSLDSLKLTLKEMLESCEKPLVDYNTGEEIYNKIGINRHY